MASIYVAMSKGLQEWGGDVGLTKHLYKVGASDAAAAEAVEALNAANHAGQADWKLVKGLTIDEADEDAVVGRLAQRERMVDPALYPRLRGARGIFKVKLESVANHFLVKSALAGDLLKVGKMKPADIAQFLLSNAGE